MKSQLRLKSWAIALRKNDMSSDIKILKETILVCADISRMGLGFVYAGIFFVLFVVFFSMAGNLAPSSRITNKLEAAALDGALQYPGRYDKDDQQHGFDTFSDCVVLQIAYLNQGSFGETLSRSPWKPADGTHPCNTLHSLLLSDPAANAEATENYNRYWWGEATLAKIVLGLSPLSLASYESMIWAASLLGGLCFVVTFFYAYRKAALFFAPLMFLMILGYNLNTFWQSLSHAPELIIAFFALSIANLKQKVPVSFIKRSFLYMSFGAVCSYFDFINGNILYVIILIGCRLLAGHIAGFFRWTGLPYSRKYDTSFITLLFESLFCFVLGIAFAIMLRLVNAAYSDNIGFLSVLHQWTEVLSSRMDGDVGAYHIRDIPSWIVYDIIIERIKFQLPFSFYGVLSQAAVLLYAPFGCVSWGTALAFAPIVHIKRRLPISVSIAFIGLGSMIALWFIVFAQHTILHSWMTARLANIWIGLGLSYLLVISYGYSARHS